MCRLGEGISALQGGEEVNHASAAAASSCRRHVVAAPIQLLCFNFMAMLCVPFAQQFNPLLLIAVELIATG